MASSSSATSAGDRPPSGASGGLPPPQAHAEWAASMQAYYAAAAGHPYVAWPAPQQQQHGLMTAGTGAAYGAPVPFPLYRHPAAAYYAHASMAAGLPYRAGEEASAVTKGKRKTVTRRAPSGEGASSSGSGDAGSQGSSEKGAAAGDDQKGSSSTKRRKSDAADTEGEPSQAATMQSPVTEPALVDKGMPAPKLPVSAATLPNAAPTLNVGMDPRSASPSVVTPSGQGEVNAKASSQSNGSLSLMDERELKRERRKQSNRDSARRSRLRKQQECEELTQKVSDLTAWNATLRSELDQLKKDCKAMEAENTQLMDEMRRAHDDGMLQSEGHSVTTTLGIQVEQPKARHGGNCEHHRSTK